MAPLAARLALLVGAASLRSSMASLRVVQSVCPAGFGQTSDAADCRKCPVGSWSGEGSAECSLCEPGTYSAWTGADACVACPVGTWTDEAGTRACKLCPAGKWTNTTRSTLESTCESCFGESCLPYPVARVTIDMQGLLYEDLQPTEQAALRDAFARDIAAAAGVRASSVQDWLGESSTVTIVGDGVSAFVLDLAAGSSAHDLARSTYGEAFQQRLLSSAAAVLGSLHETLRVGAIAMEPEHFVTSDIRDFHSDVAMTLSIMV